MKNFMTFALTVLFCTVLTSFNLIGQCSNNDPTSKKIVPTTVLGDNNPNVPGCIKFDPPVAGTLDLDAYGNQITIVKSTGACGEILSWSVPENIVVDQIIAKGSNGYNIYNYAGTGYTSDGNLHSPVNSSGKYANFSHYNICFHYKLSVSKTATTTFTRTYTWGITKACLGASELTLSAGQVFMYDFRWIATSTPHDANFKVSGSITIQNNTPVAVTITSIADILSDGTGATISGFPSLPFTLQPGQSVVGTYHAFPADADPGTNTVTVTTSTARVEGNTGKANYSFGSPTTEVDKCITVTDNCEPGSVSVCAAQSPFTKPYWCSIGPYSCGTDETYTNRVSFTANNSGATGFAECSVAVTVPECSEGCTLTQGYWKTHSIKGPAKKADPTWDLVGGPNALFYLSGKTWYQVLWTPPAGNAYYNLAHQFIAARLNILSGASTTAEVDACMAFAATFFSTNAPSTKLSKTLRAQVLACAGTLDSYNNGAIGPGHCDEDGTSSSTLVANSPYKIDARPDQQKLQLTPNPARSEVQINLSSFVGMDVEIQLTDRLGRILLVQKLDNLETSVFNLQLNALSIPSGMYQVTVRSSELLLTEPLVIQSDK